MLYIGFKALRAQPAKPVAEGELQPEVGERTPRAAFTAGFVTNGLNPKATLFFLSLFTVVINPHTPLAIQAGYGVYLAVATALWFCLVAMLFSQQRVRAGGDRAAGQRAQGRIRQGDEDAGRGGVGGLQRGDSEGGGHVSCRCGHTCRRCQTEMPVLTHCLRIDCALSAHCLES